MFAQMSSLTQSQSSRIGFKSLTILLVLQGIIRVSSASDCYWFDGNEGDSNIQACHNDLATGQHSACCTLGKSPPDLCLAGGLCYRQDSSDGNNLIYAIGCTDETGVNAACQQYCPAGNGVAIYTLNSCPDGRWCCNDNTDYESCCDSATGEGIFTMDNSLSLDPPPSTAADGAAAIVTVMTNVGPTCPTSAGSGIKEGVFIGVSVGAAIAGFVLAIIMFRVKRLSHPFKEKECNLSIHGEDDGMSAWALSQNSEASSWRHERAADKEVSGGPPIITAEDTDLSQHVVPGTGVYELEGTERGS